MLVSIFGVWLMASNITMLDPSGFGKNCTIYFASGGDFYTANLSKVIPGKTCDQVAEEINKKNR